MKFKINAKYKPAGDQPQAIAKLTSGLGNKREHQVLLGVTGSGKTFTMASTIAAANRPALIISHNKTLAAQLYSEFKAFFPNNAVHYFVSYYDYYQPEAYVAHSDTYIEKEADVNEQIEKLRNAATAALLTRQDVIIVASVSCIYGLGNPTEYENAHIKLRVKEVKTRSQLLTQLVDMRYERNQLDFWRGKFRVLGDSVQVFPSYEDIFYRIDFFGDEIEAIYKVNHLTGEIISQEKEIEIFPAKHFIASEEKTKNAIASIRKELEERLKALTGEGKVLEAERLKQRTNYDLEMLEQVGYCNGIENYSRHLDGRKPGSAPSCLLDYFPKDYLLFIDESHITLPQITGMYRGDRARKENLIEYGFRLPSALDNRPLTFAEFKERVGQSVYVSATPAEYELDLAASDAKKVGGDAIVEQIVRPTGLLDPEIEIRPTKGQIDDLLAEIQLRTKRGQRVLVTTLTKRLAEDLTNYLKEINIKVQYLHSDVETLKRIEILRELRQGKYDVLVGINLLREGLDLPEVSLVAILDADKEGFLRSSTSLIQTCGRAARHSEGRVIMYADNTTKSMQFALDETARRRKIQLAYNKKHGVTPTTITKDIDSSFAEMYAQQDELKDVNLKEIPADERQRLTRELEIQMRLAAANLEFEKAAKLRDDIRELKELA